VIIDSHVHIWDLSRAEYDWLGPGLAPINRTLLLDDLAQDLDSHDVGGVVLVQAADNADDTALMLDAAASDPRVVAVVGWAPLDQPGVLPGRLDHLASAPVVRGIRNLFHARPREWATSAPVDEGIGIVAAAGLTLDFVTSDPAALADLPGIGERHPGLSIVIDHLGKPPIGGTATERAQWRALLADCAANPRMHAKVSGLYSSIGALGDWTTDAVQPFVDDAIELFGPARLMAGGDWPISELAGGFDRTWTGIESMLSHLPDGDRAAILGATARRFYGIDPPESS
jgi:L-fuconolactonase